ncbi:B-cell CLL/lymphoma 9-like protein isoform X2 [Acipenser ruthenus]|uniref:B-cell CLL/lymphoma 9-like protein isoform X2 n=1 Tax=Acipenser ruthenus TaxID=7906 RepID=UPI002741EF7C|nr:B-cell CLL/lymphoma 9-like protein isoform X2 [Acipenser ruthenus]
MHPDSKLTNHGKQVNSSAQSQHQNVSQGPAGSLGSKGAGAGNHGGGGGGKANQISPGNSGLKSQAGGGVGPLKGKRERSVSIDSGEQREALTPSLEPDSKEGVMRSKRRCVLEKKQPYSGDEWCSGAESEEEEDKPITAAPGPAKHRGDHSRAGPPQPPPGSNPLSSLCESASSVVPLGMGAGLRAELGSGPKPLVYVFTTNLANSAAEAVMQGRADSIVVFHQQTVPRTKLDKCLPPPSKVLGLPDQLHAATPPGGTPKSQSGTPRPSSSGQLNPAGTPSSVGPPEGATDEPPDALTLPSSSGGNKKSSSTNNHSNNSLPPSGGSATNSSSSKPLPGLVEPPSVPPTPPPPAPAQQGDSDPGNVPAQRGGNTEGLSKQQLEHRERSLQTLRDIERLLLRSGGGGGVVGPGGDPSTNNNNNNGSLGPNCSNNGPNSSPQAPPPPALGGNPNQQQQVKKYEEPLQSIISQTQSLVGGLDEPAMSQGGCGGPPPPHLQHPHPPHSHMHPSHHGLPPHSSPSSLDMCLLMNQQDGLTPEQMAWRKLQEEYYQEKRRKQEQIGLHPHPHPRMMGDGGPEMGMTGMIRGPPPPYHSKAGEPLPPQQQQWLPGMAGGGGNGGRMLEMHLEGGGPRGPRFHPGMQRLGPGPGGGGYPGGGNPGGMMGLDPMGPMNPMQRPPGRPSMGWLEDMPPMGGGGGGGGPPVGFGGYPPMQHLQGDPERMLNPRAREEMFRMMEKRQIQGMQRQAAMNQAMEMERMQQQQQGGGNGPRMMEQAGGPGGGFANSVGDPMDFPGSRAMMGSPMGGVGCGGGHQQPPMRELVEHQMGNLNMNMNVNMNMNLNLQMNQQQQQMLMTQKMRLAGGPLNELLHQEEMARSRAQNGGGMAGNKMMMPGGGPFPNQGPFPGGPGGYLPQDMGNPQTPQEMFSPDQQGPPMGGTSRLSHMPRSGGGVLGGRRPSDLTINVHPMNSPGMPPHHLKSPTVNQVHSPMLPSPSPAGLKSPQLSSLGGPPNPGPPPSSSMKSSPQVLGPSSLGVRSPTGGSPSRLKSPSVPVPSPGAWAPSPKTALPSPGVPQGGKGGNAMDSGPHPPRSNTCGGINPSMPFTSSPGGAPSQNPLSLIMSQMSKYAMPSSTPLYHDAIKTIATSDDELLPDRPLLPGGNMAGESRGARVVILDRQGCLVMVLESCDSTPGLTGVGGNHQPPPMHSPMGMVLPGQQPPLSHDPSGPMLHSPNPMNMPSMHGGGGNPMLMAGGPQDHMGPRNGSPMLPQNQMGGGVTGGGFPRLQPPPHGPMHSPGMGMGAGLPQAYPPGMTLPPPDEVMVPHPGQMHLLKGLSHQQQQQQQQHRPPSASYLGDADLSDVIRSTPTGIPEFDLSRIIPSEKPSSTLQYFPKSNESLQQQQPHHKQQQPPSSSSSNPHLINLQNMMAEQQLPVQPPPGRPPMGGPRSMGGMGGMQMCHPGHMMGRTAMPPPQQGMMVNNMHPHPGVMSPSQHSLLAQQNLMMMQAKQQRSMSVSGDMYGQQGHLMSPQGALMGPPNLQQGMMVPAQMRQRSISLDGPMGYGPGSMANLPF